MDPLSVASVITRRVRPTLAVVAAVAATAFFGSAMAQPDEEPVHLEYHAPPGCEDGAQFFARARSRAPRMRVARPDERARMFVVDIEQRGGRTAGRLVVRNPEGRQTVREIEARDCSEAVDALALVVALVVNPRAISQPAATAAPGEPEPTLPAPTAPSSAPSPPAPDPPTSTPLPPARATTEGEAAANSSLPANLSRGASVWAFRTGLAAWGISAMAPEPLLGARASAEILHEGTRWMAPSFRASLGYMTRAGFVVDGGTAHFSYAGTNLEICPLRIPPGGPLVLRPCVMADVGLLFSRGADALNPQDVTRPWLDIGAGGRLEWMLGRRVGVELDVACTFPVWRDRFLFGPRSFHRVAAVGGAVALGFLIRIP
jgi:hypothetical protein